MRIENNLTNISTGGVAISGAIQPPGVGALSNGSRTGVIGKVKLIHRGILIARGCRIGTECYGILATDCGRITRGGTVCSLRVGIGTDRGAEINRGKSGLTG